MLNVDYKTLLPSEADQQILMNNMSILVSRVLVVYLPFFKLHFEDAHISHPFQNEMSMKSEFVSV